MAKIKSFQKLWKLLFYYGGPSATRTRDALIKSNKSAILYGFILSR